MTRQYEICDMDEKSCKLLTTTELRSNLKKRDVESRKYIRFLTKKFSWKKAFQAYYRSNLWIKWARPLLIEIYVREEHLLRSGFQYLCPACKKWVHYNQLNPHHIKYKMKYNSYFNNPNPKWIIIICMECHKKIHRRK